MDIAKVLEYGWLGASYSLNANDYAQLRWDPVNTLSKPSLEELEEKWQEYLEKKASGKLDPLSKRLERTLLAGLAQTLPLLAPEELGNIFKLKAALVEADKFLPEMIFSQVATSMIEAFPPLPGDVEPVRAALLAELAQA